MSKQIFYNILDKDGSVFHGGTGKWHLPKNGKPGKWMPKIQGKLELCKNGYHLCRQRDLVDWLGPDIYIAEYRGEMVRLYNKVVVAQARLTRKLKTWNDISARLFACDCAEHVLKYNGDPRVKNAITIAREYAYGRVDKKTLTAAESAARSAVRDAFGGNDWNATWGAAKAAAGAAACDAARVTAGATAWAAAGATAGATAWGTALGTAWSAAGHAAWAAARVTAWAAAWDAAEASAGATAGDAAWDDEKKWQTKRLMKYLRGELP